MCQSERLDAYLAITSKRDERRYSDRPLPEEVVRRILDAGRVAGSSRNRQLWRFAAVSDRTLLERLAETVRAPENVRECALAVVVAMRGTGTGFDAGRVAQNMMLAAWNDGVVSCPNGMAEPARTAALVGLDADETPATVLSFAYPARPRRPEARPAEEWSARADRKPLEEIVLRAETPA